MERKWEKGGRESERKERGDIEDERGTVRRDKKRVRTETRERVGGERQ